MSKIEKTLELNITHEILSLADSFWLYLQPISLKRYWRPHWRFPLIPTPKSFATGLHINLEGKKGGGYDVCINSPANFQGGNPRLLFMQFKAGVEKQFNSNSASIFSGDKQHPNVHVEFDINSNAKNNQHKLLKDLANKAGNKDAVVYVFPRIVNNEQLQKNVGKLLRKTSFISISEMDSKAAANNVTIDDGNPHKFRTCYHDYNKNEVNFFFFFFGKPANPGGLLGEIFSIRMYRALHELKKVQVENYPISRYHIMDAMIRHVLNIGLHFSIPLSIIENFLSQYPNFNQRLNNLYEFEDLPFAYKIEEPESNEYEKEIVNDILNSISQYFLWINKFNNFMIDDIPQPTSEYTIEVKQDGIRFEIEKDDEIENISYSFI